MKKLVLNLDDLDVTSFDTAAPQMDVRGTVDGHAGPITDVVEWMLSCFVCPQAAAE
jgi:hypothetical protein